MYFFFFFFQAEDGIRDFCLSRGLGDVYKRQDEELKEALRKASILDYVSSLKDGLDTYIKELGENFSGGEQQRLGLARCFLKDAEIYLFDEPTSNLDALNESIILNSIKKYMKGKTIIMVSHRDSTLRICDNVIKMS